MRLNGRRGSADGAGVPLPREAIARSAAEAAAAGAADLGVWPVLRSAGRLGPATRIGLEDTLLLPDGQPARCDAELVRAGLTEYRRSRARGG